MATPLTGLAGAEQALGQGLSGANQLLTQIGALGRGDITQGLQGANQALGGARSDIMAALGSGTGALNTARQGAMGQINQGIAPLQPFVDPGQQANQLRAAMSGALGPQAQQQAMQDFQSSPGQNFLLEEAERASLRNASATGGLGGGRLQQELQRQAMGFASQDFANQFGRLGEVEGTGLRAAEGIGQLRGQGAGIQSALGQMAGQMATQGAGLYGDLGRTGADIASRTGQSMADFTGRLGTAGAGNIMNTGQNLATGRTNAGNLMAQYLSGASGNLADLVAKQGAGYSDILGSATGNLAGILSGAGAGVADSQQGLAQLLAQLGLGSGQIIGGGQTSSAQFQKPVDYSSLLASLGTLGTAVGDAWPDKTQQTQTGGTTQPGFEDSIYRGL